MNIGSDSFETFRCDQAMQIGLNMTNLHKIFGAFTNGSCSITADGEDADTVQFVFETAKESSSAKKARMKVKEENAADEEESDEEREKNSDDEEMADEDKKTKTIKAKNRRSSSRPTLQKTNLRTLNDGPRRRATRNP